MWIMMKKKRTISITNPKLRKIRNSLREIISKATIDELGRIIQENTKKSKKYVDSNYSEKWGIEVKKLSDRRDKVDTALDNSICICPVCKSRTSDMTFNPYLKAWFCVECYEKNRDFYVRRGEPHIYP